MDEYNVIISPAAQNDLHDVMEHLEVLPGDAAAQYLELFIDKTAVLSSSPESNPLARDTQLRLRGYRFLPIENYIVFYVINGNVVDIRRILYARRQYEWLF
ncbi:MAG: type II toxin-antitoxin system RelE/ParE family toxin [Oscillospiraceae bacterium]|nr:type II toxin-antitoxin system RelE/ParE family toxin [Oscillospiraceae bacterium]